MKQILLLLFGLKFYIIWVWTCDTWRYPIAILTQKWLHDIKVSSKIITLLMLISYFHFIALPSKLCEYVNIMEVADTN